jgi:hypothetical protein
MSWGPSEWGSGSWGGSGAGFDLTAAWTASAQAIRLRFSRRVATGSTIDGEPAGVWLPLAYTLTVSTSALVGASGPVPVIMGAALVTPTEVELVLDRPLGPTSLVYLIGVNPDLVRSEAGARLGVHTATFAGVTTRDTSPIAERTDADPQLVDVGFSTTPGANPVGMLVGANGDLALTESADTIRARIVRRVTTAKGGFAWLPDFGLLPKTSALARKSALYELRLDAQAQIEQEPFAESATVQLRHLIGRGVYFLDSRVTLTQGGQVALAIPITAGG